MAPRPAQTRNRTAGSSLEAQCRDVGGRLYDGMAFGESRQISRRAWVHHAATSSSTNTPSSSLDVEGSEDASRKKSETSVLKCPARSSNKYLKHVSASKPKP